MGKYSLIRYGRADRDATDSLIVIAQGTRKQMRELLDMYWKFRHCHRFYVSLCDDKKRFLKTKDYLLIDDPMFTCRYAVVSGIPSFKKVAESDFFLAQMLFKGRSHPLFSILGRGSLEEMKKRHWQNYRDCREKYRCRVNDDELENYEFYDENGLCSYVDGDTYGDGDVRSVYYYVFRVFQ